MWEVGLFFAPQALPGKDNSRQLWLGGTSKKK